MYLRVTLELSCDMEMQHYPHDIQQCGVDIMACEYVVFIQVY